jgi:PAS domain S-box-containing protein
MEESIKKLENIFQHAPAAIAVLEGPEASRYARSLIEASLDPLVTINANGKITDVNEASIKVTGIEREKLIDTDFSDYFTEPKKAQEGYQQVFEKGFVADYPLTIKHKNGNLTDVLYNASVYKDAKGNVLGAFAAARDVTEQKKVENVLKESEEKFKLIFEKSIAPIIIADDKGNYLEVNKAAAEIFECSINELVGMNVGDLITTSNPNATAQYEEYIKKGEEIGEFGFISNKGTPKIVQYQAVRIKPDCNLSILTNITEQKKSSLYARSLIEASLDPLVTISIDGKILDVNEASVKVTGVSREKLIDTDFSNYFTEPKKAQEGYQKVFEKGFVADYPLTIKHKNGNLTDVLYNASVYKDDKGNVLGVFAAARDVTDRKKAEEKIIESENEIRKVKEQLELSIQAGKIGVWFWDVKKDILTWSKEQNEMYGFSASEVITSAAQFNALMVPEDLNRIQVDQSGGDRIDHEYDFRIIRKNDGELRWIKSRARNTLDSQGALQSISGVNIDVTEQVLAFNKIKESEEALAKQKQLLESVTENAGMALFLMDEKQYCIYMNQAAEKMTGFTLKELKGEKLHYHVHHSHPDGSPYPMEECPIDQALPSQNRMKGEEVFVHKEGFFFPVAYTASPITFNGTTIGTVIEIRDTTEEKRKEQELKTSESRFRSLAETLPQMVWVMSGDDVMEYGSKNWKEYSGIDDVMEAWNYMIHPDDRERSTAFWNQVLAQRKGFQKEVRLKNKEGIYRWFDSVGEPVLDANEKISKWVGSLTDIHERKAIEEMLELKVATRTQELYDKNAELQELNKELEAFTYISSHDLQEPLRKIQTFAGRIIGKEKEQLSDTAKDYFSRMQNAATRMQTLIQDLLLFSSLGKSERKFEITGMNKMVEEVKEELKEVMEEKHAFIEATELGEVNIIPFQFRQLLHNLISNALKFSRVDVPPRIIIKSLIAKGLQLNNDKLLPDTKYCHISFADNGIGFDKIFSEKIFGVFQKLHGKEEYAGTGIGLAIVKKIVDNHNGIVTAVSELGKGATFNIYLPQSQPMSAPATV